MKTIKKHTYLLFLFPSFLGVSIFVLIPFVDVIRRSFIKGMSGKFNGVNNYILIFKNEAFLLAVKNTLHFTMVCLPLLITISLILAVLLSKLEHVKIIKTLFLFPMAVPIATVVLLWKIMFYKTGFLNLLLSYLGNVFHCSWAFDAAGAPDYMNSKAAFYILVASYIWKNLGYTIILWLAGIWGISPDIIEAAKVDGAGEWSCFIKIILPNLKGTLYTITVLSFLNSFKVFREAYLIAGAYPHKSIYLLQHLFNNWFLNMELDKMAAAAVCVGTVLLFIILLLQGMWEEKA